MVSMCINTSVNCKQTLEQAVSRSPTDMPSVLGSRTSAPSSLLGEFQLPARRGASPHTRHSYKSSAPGTGSKQTFRWTSGRNDTLSFETTNQMELWNPAI